MTYPCDPMCPFLGCASCDYSGGEIPAAATESDARTGVECATIGGTQTSGPGLHTETALVTPVRFTEREDYP